MVNKPLKLVSKILGVLHFLVELFDLLVLTFLDQGIGRLHLFFHFFGIGVLIKAFFGLDGLILLTSLSFGNLGLLEQPLGEEVNWVGGLSLVGHSHSLGDNQANLILFKILSIFDVLL
jgi:hypothetical protein